MKHYLVLVHSRTNLKLDNSNIAQDRKFRANFQKIQNLTIKVLLKFIAKNYSILVHSRTKFELDEFAQVKQFRANLKKNSKTQKI